MADVKIGVNADGSNVAKAIDEITDSVNTLAKAVADAGKIKFQPVDVQTARQDLQTLNKQFDVAVQRSKSLRDALKTTGQSGRPIHEIDFRKLSVDPSISQRMRDKAFGYSARGTAWDMENFAPLPASPANPAPGNGSPSTPRRQSTSDREKEGIVTQAGKTFANGVGGGFGQIANSAINGASTGAQSGGLTGGLGGMLKGGLVGAGLFGLFKAGQAVSEGYAMAKERDIGLDTLKRQMGDLGVSFVGLKAMSDIASQGLGLNSKEFVELAEHYNKINYEAHDGTAPQDGGVMGQVRTAVSFSRAYGMDPDAGVHFFAGMKQFDPRQSNRELALQIGEAVNRGGGRIMADDVMRMMQSFSASTARLSLSTPDSGAYSAALGSMLHGGSQGMTADNAAAILGQANSAIAGMGQAGEAGQNFIMGSFNAQGLMNPVAAKAQAAAGLFGTRAAVFGDGTELNKYLRGYGINPQQDGTVTAQNRDVTNFQSIRANLEHQYRDPYLRLDGAQRLFGFSSPEQAAALLNLNPDQFSGLSKSVRRAGVSINDVNPGGIATLTAIGGADNHAALDTIYADIGKRTGASALTASERTTLDSAQKGGTEDFRDALIKIMASKDQAETEGSKLRASLKDLETAQTSIGDKMIGPLNTMRDALLKLAGSDGKSATVSSLRKAAYDAERADMNTGYDEQIKAVKHQSGSAINNLVDQRDKLISDLTGQNVYPSMKAPDRAALKKQIADIDAQMKALGNQSNLDIANLEKKRAADRAEINAREQHEKEETDKFNRLSAGGRSSNSPATTSNLSPSSNAPASSGKSAGKSLQTISERNHNPFDMRPWKSDQAQADGFLTFPDMQSGVTAGFKNLLYAQDGHDRHTISQIISAYAPEKDHNDTRHYIDSVAKMTGFGADQQIDLHDPKVLQAVGLSILKNENAYNTVTNDQIDQGVRAALGESPSKIVAPNQGGNANTNRDGVRDTLNVNIQLATTGTNNQGATVQHNLQTSVAVPRGSGVQSISLTP